MRAVFQPPASMVSVVEAAAGGEPIGGELPLATAPGHVSCGALSVSWNPGAAP